MISPHAQPGGDPPTGYAELARWLVRSLVSESARVRDVEATGRRIGREMGATRPTSPASSACTRFWPHWAFSPNANRSPMTG